MRKRKIPDASQGYLLLYHLYRIGIIPKSDLTAYRGIKQDRYLQKVVSKYKKCGYIGGLRYRECDYNFITEKGVEYLRSKDVSHRNPLKDDCYEYIINKEPVRSDIRNHEIELYLKGVPITRKNKRNWNVNEARNEVDGVECEQTANRNTALKVRNQYILNEEGWEPLEWEPVKLLHISTKLMIERYEEGKHSKAFLATIRKNTSMSLLRAAGILIFPEEKPHYQVFLKILSRKNYEETFLWQLICERGIFYHRQELNINETKHKNRMQGVLFTKSGWYVVYNTLGNFSYWVTTTENESVNNLSANLHLTLPYINKPASSLVFSSGRGMVAAMVNGYAHGHNRRTAVPNNMFYYNKDRGTYMTVEKMIHLYKQIYLAELNSGGIYSLTNFVQSDEESKREMLIAMAKGNPTVFEIGKSIGSGELTLVEKETGREVVIQDIYNLSDLYKRRKGVGDVTVIGPSWMADPTAKCLYSKLKRYISIDTGFDIEFSHFDENGELMDMKRSISLDEVD